MKNPFGKRKEPLTDTQLLMTITIGIFVVMYILAMTLLGGGKFKISGSIIGVYVIQMLTITLYAMKVSSTDIKAYKAIVIILLVVIGSPVIKKRFEKLMARLRERKSGVSAKGAGES